MSGTDISKAYEPAQVEQRWYQAWLDAHAFAGVADPAKEPFCIVIPPPNVTGVLTMGHVLNNTIQDILARRARQEGKAVLWLPGTDHAGLATQTRVEKELKKEGLDRRKMGREKFFQKVVEWRDKHGGIIIEQLKRLGCSCDWDRTVHTLDPDYSRAVLTAFVKLYEAGHIYRGKRMVNWCPASQTALSDEEVILKPQKGVLYHMRYEIVEHPGKFIPIATTRPETLMGDTAVAVHPQDPRYGHLHGAHVWRPFPRAQIPIIFDTAVDKDFGSGALKVTPAHDKADFEIGQRHHLPVIEVIDAGGKLNELAGEEFKGMDRFKARKVAAEKLKELGLLDKEEPYENSVGFSERADVPIEPRLSEQWFLKYPRVQEAKDVVCKKDANGKSLIQFWPNHWEKVYGNWLDKIQDWCISRQVWWGHRIPVWYKKGADRNDAKNRHVSVDGPPDPQNWEQDEDSLDTWASSWLWPFATMGWPAPNEKQAAELNFWYPTSDLVTGPDIIFFWVARMIIAGLEFMRPGEPLDRRIPFKNVYFTGIIRDKQGRKMSKSLGNSPDPLELIDKYGADGLRFGTMKSAPMGNDIHFDETNVELGRNFCNKLWNAARFRKMHGPTDQNGNINQIIQRCNFYDFSSFDGVMLNRLHQFSESVQKSYNDYDFNLITLEFYDFFWSYYCDFYLEVSKPMLQDESKKGAALAMQDLCLRELLINLQPFMPFITEELWHELGYGSSREFLQNIAPISLEDLPDFRGIVARVDPKIVDNIRETVSLVKALKARSGLANKKDAIFHVAVKPDMAKAFEKQRSVLTALIGAEKLIAIDSSIAVDGPSVLTPHGSFYLELKGLVDLVVERTKLSKEIENLNKVISGSEAKLANEAFTSKAPANVIEGARKQLAENQAKCEELRRLLAALK